MVANVVSEIRVCLPIVQFCKQGLWVVYIWGMKKKTLLSWHCELFLQYRRAHWHIENEKNLNGTFVVMSGTKQTVYHGNLNAPYHFLSLIILVIHQWFGSTLITAIIWQIPKIRFQNDSGDILDRNQVWCLSEDLTVLLSAEEPTNNWTFMNVLEVVKFGA